MKAVIIRRHGGPEVLEVVSAPTPKPGAGEVLVRLEAAALNHLDLWTRAGGPAFQVPLPHILGAEGAGTVAGLGPGATGFTVGQPVLVSPGVSCGVCPSCARGWDSLCDGYQIVGRHRPGCYAEFVSVPARSVWPRGAGPSAVEWSAVPLTGLTAWHMLITRGRLAPGETVLIHAAGSGLSTMGIQIAKLAGARVIVTAGTDRKLDLARTLGADEAVNYQTQDFAEEVLRLTGGRGVDLVFDHVGETTWPGSFKCLAKGGRLVNAGASSGPQAAFDIRPFFSRQHSVIGCYLGGRAELARVLELVEAKRLRPVIDRTFPLERAADAHRYMEDRTFFGKIVLEIGR